MRYIAILKNRSIVTENDNATEIVRDAKQYAKFSMENVYIIDKEKHICIIVTPDGKIGRYKNNEPKKWHSFEFYTIFECDKFSEFLKSHNIQYEKSAINKNAAHFSVYYSASEEKVISDYLYNMYDPADDMMACYCI